MRTATECSVVTTELVDYSTTFPTTVSPNYLRKLHMAVISCFFSSHCQSIKPYIHDLSLRAMVLPAKTDLSIITLNAPKPPHPTSLFAQWRSSSQQVSGRCSSCTTSSGSSWEEFKRRHHHATANKRTAGDVKSMLQGSQRKPNRDCWEESSIKLGPSQSGYTDPSPPAGCMQITMSIPGPSKGYPMDYPTLPIGFL